MSSVIGGHQPARCAAFGKVLLAHELLELAAVRFGVNYIAFPVFCAARTRPSGAISMAALAHRTPLERPTTASDETRRLIEGRLGSVAR